MVAGELSFGKLVSAVHAQAGIPPEKFVIGQRRLGTQDRVPAARTLDGDDAVNDEA